MGLFTLGLVTLGLLTHNKPAQLWFLPVLSAWRSFI
ncbi:hypothetical protein H6F87_11575 [Cyanobacteria bacterium FACHB-502]|nr:hypothetical protein [Cyanobacteria bacterium FACHB-502]MBD2024677.1 hypothetical protein [Leptolyngbya sp. FACHB-711]